MADDDDYIDYDDYVFEEKKRRSSLNNFARRQCRNLAHFLVEDWCLSAVLGISMAFCSVGMDYWIEHLQQWHVTLYKYAQDISDHAAFGAWTGYVLVLVLASTIFVHYVAPQAIGSGIPEVKTIMRGVMLKEYVTFRTLISKMVGLTLSLGSGLPIGKEGPFIHVAATVGTLISKLTSSCNKGVYANESRYSEMLATACAVGVSCTFSAPVGGVLFSIEVTAVHFAVRNYWRAFFAAACSAIVFRLLRIFLQQTDTAVVAFYQTNFPQESFFPEELPIFALLGIICGFLGAFYIIVHRKISLFVKNNDLFKKVFKANLLVYPVAVTMLVTSLTYPSGYGKLIAGHLKFRDVLQDFFGSCSWYKTPGSDSDSLTCKRDLLDHWTGGANGDISIFITLICFIVTFFLLSLICTTLPVPCGIFMPVFVIGAATGRLLGESVAILFPEGIRGIEETQIYPGVYAIVGAAALSGACTHTVSVAVIVFELTGQITYMLPVLIAILFSNAICTYLQPSIYDSTIKMKRLPYLPAIPPSRSSVHVVKAEQIMVVNVKYITKLTTYRELRDLLAEVPNLRSFPVVTDSESKILLGSVSRRYLMRVLRQNVSFSKKQYEEDRRRKISGHDSIISKSSSVPPSPIRKERPKSLTECRIWMPKDKEESRTAPLKERFWHPKDKEDLRTASLKGRTWHSKEKDDTRFASLKERTWHSKEKDDLRSVSLKDRQRSLSGNINSRSSNALSQIEDYVRSVSNTISSRTNEGRDDVNRLLLRQCTMLDKPINLEDAIDPAPFQLVQGTSLFKIHGLFTLLCLNHAYVTSSGRLVGVVALNELRIALENIYLMGALPTRPTMDQRKAVISNVAYDNSKRKTSHTFAVSTVTDLIESEEDASKTEADNESDTSLLTMDETGPRPKFIV